jgi:large conductance mechanosensitive channel
MGPMRRLWSEFKAIAVGGNVLDLALGFVIGTAFAALVQSFVSHIFLQLIAALIGKKNFAELAPKIGKTPIEVGGFLNDVLQFVLLAIALFVIVKFMTWIGIERGRSFEQRACPFCLDRVPRAAYVCHSCSQPLVEELPSLADAQRMLAEREARRWPTLPPIPLRRQRRGAVDEETEDAAPPC